MQDLLTKYTNEHSRFMVIDEMLIHYRDEGEGLPLLFLHGAFSSLHTFDSWVDIFKKDFRIIRYDLPGFGLTGPHPKNHYSIGYHTQIIDTFLSRLKIRKCYIAGSSLGGWLSWEYALSYPERIIKMILLDAAGFMDPKSIPLPFRMARTPLISRVIKYVIKKNVLEQFVRQVYHDQTKITPELINRYYDLFTREGNPEAFLQMVNNKFKDNTNHLKYIKIPTLVVWGKEDKWIPVENAYRFNKLLPNVKTLIYKRVGHLPMEEIPKITAKAAGKFLTEN